MPINTIDALFRSAAYLDIETLGLESGTPIHQVSLFDRLKGTATEYVPDPYRLIEKSKNPLDSDILRQKFIGAKAYSSWPEAVQERVSKGGASWLESNIDRMITTSSGQEYLYPHLRGIRPSASRTAQMGGLNVPVNVLSGMTPGGAYEDVFKRMGANQVLWIANAQFECLGPDTLIQMTNGSIIEIKDYKGGKFLGTSPENSCRRNLQEVTGFNLVNKGYKKSYKIRPRYGISVTASEKHLWFTQRGWIQTKDLTEKDWLLYNNRKWDLPESNKFNDKELELIGWFIAEGCRKTRNSVAICIAEKEYQDLLPDVYPDYTWKTNNDKDWRYTYHTYKGYIHNPPASKLLKELNLLDKYSYQKELPQEILQCSNRQLGIVIRCMWNGDGHVGRNGLVYSTTSKRLSEQLVLVLGRMGILSFIYEVDDNRKESYKTLYRVMVPAQEISKFINEIGLDSRKLRETYSLLELRKDLENHTSIYRVPALLIPDWKEIWKNYIDGLNLKLRGRTPYKKKLKEITNCNTDGMYDGNASSWDKEAFDELAEIFNVDINNDFCWVPIQSIELVGEVEVYDITTSTGEFLAAGLVVHNSRMLGAIGSVFNTTEKLRTQLTHAPAKAHELLYVSDPDVLKAKSRALATGDWRGVWEAIENIDLTRPGKKVLDVHDVVRASQSYATSLFKRINLNVDMRDAFTGVGLDIQARIMGFGPELHRATEDNMLSALIGERSATHINAFRDMTARAQSITGGVLTAQSSQEVDALNWAWKMHNLKSETAASYMKYNVIARAMYDFEFGSQYGKKHLFTTGFEQVVIPTLAEGKPSTATISKARRELFGSMPELFSYLQGTPRAQGLNLQELARELRNEVTVNGTLDRAKLEALKESEGARQATAKLSNIEGMTRFKQGDILFGSSSSIPKSSKFGGRLGYAIAGIGLGIMSLGVIGGLSKPIDQPNDNFSGMYNDDYQSWLNNQNIDQYNISSDSQLTGLSDQGINSTNRSKMSDFGSPYRGLWDSVSLQLLDASSKETPIYINDIPIDQRIANFRDQAMQTPLQKRLIEQEYTKQQIKSLDRLYFLNPELTTPLASNNYGILNSTELGANALAKNKDLQVIDLSRMNWAVEDADTIILSDGVKGLLGQDMQVRLSGIDAPEIEHSDEEISALRYKQGQPHGEESKAALEAMLRQSKDIKLVVDPKADTYGRALGVLLADGQNINLELIRRGHVAALPFGAETSDLIDRDVTQSYEQMAYQNNMGMWSDNYWRTYRKTVNPDRRITFNTLARIDKLAGNMNLAALETTMSLSRDPGYSELTYQSIPYLKTKLANFGVKRPYQNFVVPVNYQSNQQHLDQLKIETARHMTKHGNLLADTKMKVSSHQFGNVNFAVDSLERSSSIYHSKLPAIIDKYERKVTRRKIQGETQRAVNRQIMSNGDRVRM